MRDHIWLDLETTGLSPKAMPIEIGVASFDLSHEAILVRLPDTWDRSLWEKPAEEIHGLTYEKVMDEGHSSKDALDWLSVRIRHKKIVSDQSSHDERWLNNLIRTSSAMPFVPIEHDLTILADEFAAKGVDIEEMLEILDRRLPVVQYYFPHTHRANEDALLCAALFRAMLDEPFWRDLQAQLARGVDRQTVRQVLSFNPYTTSRGITETA